MSHINFDFLTESFLFGYGLEDNFSALSDYELEKELNRYREYVISNMGEICREIISDSRKIAVTIESFSERPREELLKQLALYVDVVTISDPLFELTEKKSNSTKVMAEYYGMNSDNTIDREQLVAALKYMKESTILVVCNYVKYIPISYLHEAPMNVPITYDANNFSKSLPQPIMEFLKKNVQVHNTVRMDGGLRVELDKPLTRGTGLFIHFPDCGFKNGEMYIGKGEIDRMNESIGERRRQVQNPQLIGAAHVSTHGNNELGKMVEYKAMKNAGFERGDIPSNYLNTYLSGETAWNANPSLRAEATELADKLKADFDADVERRRRNSY